MKSARRFDIVRHNRMERECEVAMYCNTGRKRSSDTFRISFVRDFSIRESEGGGRLFVYDTARRRAKYVHGRDKGDAVRNFYSMESPELTLITGIERVFLDGVFR